MLQQSVSVVAEKDLGGKWEGDYWDGKEGRKLNSVLPPELL